MVVGLRIPYNIELCSFDNINFWRSQKWSQPLHNIIFILYLTFS